MITYKEFTQKLEEARKNPEMNPKISAYEALYPYRNENNMFIHFTVTNRLGLKPSATYEDTPLAIYAYPLKELWIRDRIDQRKSFRFIPYAGDFKYIKLFKWNGKGIFINDLYSNYTDTNFSNDMKKLRKLFPDVKQSIIDSNYEKLTNKIIQYGGELGDNTVNGLPINVYGLKFNISNEPQSIEYNKIITDLKPLETIYNNSLIKFDDLIDKIYSVTKYEDISNPKMFLKITKLLSNYGVDPNVDAFFRGVFHTPKNGNLNMDDDGSLPNMKVSFDYIRNWSSLLLKLEYAGMCDRKGTGMIHPNEPIQAFFLSKSFITEIDTIYNNDYIKRTPVNFKESIDYLSFLNENNALPFDSNKLGLILNTETVCLDVCKNIHNQHKLKRILNRTFNGT